MKSFFSFQVGLVENVATIRALILPAICVGLTLASNMCCLNPIRTGVFGERLSRGGGGEGGGFTLGFIPLLSDLAS